MNFGFIHSNMPPVEEIPTGSLFCPVSQFTPEQLGVIFGDDLPKAGVIVISTDNQGKLLQRVLAHFIEKNTGRPAEIVRV